METRTVNQCQDDLRRCSGNSLQKRQLRPDRIKVVAIKMLATCALLVMSRTVSCEDRRRVTEDQDGNVRRARHRRSDRDTPSVRDPTAGDGVVRWNWASTQRRCAEARAAFVDDAPRITTRVGRFNNSGKDGHDVRIAIRVSPLRAMGVVRVGTDHGDGFDRASQSSQWQHRLRVAEEDDAFLRGASREGAARG